MKSFRDPPCNKCPFKGCGAYHDKCPDFQAYRREKEMENKKRTEDVIVRSYIKVNHDKMLKEKFRKEKR